MAIIFKKDMLVGEDVEKSEPLYTTDVDGMLKNVKLCSHYRK